MMPANAARDIAHSYSERSLSQRIEDQMEAVEAAILNEAKNERYSTLLDFARADVAEAVMARLIHYGYQVHVSAFRSTNSADGDAVPSLEVRW
jgi:hypothetical protein